MRRISKKNQPHHALGKTTGIRASAHFYIGKSVECCSTLDVASGNAF